MIATSTCLVVMSSAPFVVSFRPARALASFARVHLNIAMNVTSLSGAATNVFHIRIASP